MRSIEFALRQSHIQRNLYPPDQQVSPPLLRILPSLLLRIHLLHPLFVIQPVLVTVSVYPHSLPALLRTLPPLPPLLPILVASLVSLSRLLLFHSIPFSSSTIIPLYDYMYISMHVLIKCTVLHPHSLPYTPCSLFDSLRVFLFHSFLRASQINLHLPIPLPSSFPLALTPIHPSLSISHHPRDSSSNTPSTL